MMLLIQSMYSLSSLNPITRLPALFQRLDKAYIQINTHDGNGLDVRSLIYAIHMLSNFITETEYFGSFVFKVAVYGHVVADGILARELRASNVNMNSTSIATTA